ncbi:ATP-binding cassette domain-containing protein [Shewanella polaris]|uniref:ATP-binding cassette domain-containing protein n=1 Tax=Shewanella polaris TaxID=2588449 RepID=A0A4Y5YEW2_9GAMM|nr:ABC transporter ATP-binding protein [Shewanella polaris]QDE31089.1 ATP-binding cassette domain-containing protein [Shewanella polaris]
MKLLELKNVSVSYGSHLPKVLQNINLVISRGQCHCVSGPTGSGKSSLLNLLAGVLNHPHDGDIWSNPQLLAGLVTQDPQTQLLRNTVGAEVAFTLENIGVPAKDMLPKVQLALRRVGLHMRLDTKVNTLSLGQKYRLIMASQLVCEPNLLLLDEPWAQLDDKGVSELLAVLHNLIQDGMALVLVEHNPHAFADIIQYYWQFDDGDLSEGIYSINSDLRPQLGSQQKSCRKEEEEFIDDVVISAKAFEFRFDGNPKLFTCPQDLTLYAGEIVSLIGDNGSGKTSLLRALAGVLSLKKRLPLTVLERTPKLGVYGAELGFLMQRPSRQLFETNVLAEMQFSLKRFDLPQIRATEMLEELELTTLSNLSPHTLSYGQQHIIALASLACLQPKLLLLDDPLAGMDKFYYSKVWYLLERLQSQGCTILLSSHRSIKHHAISRQFGLREGLLQEESI